MLFVLLDMVRVTYWMDYVTHLTAIRVDEYWQETEQLKLIIRPLVRYWTSPVHTDYYDMSIFNNSKSEAESVSCIKEWLQSDDIILVWTKKKASFLKEVLDRHRSDWEPPPIYHFKSVILDKAQKIRPEREYENLEDLLTSCGESVSFLQNKAPDGSNVMARLFINLGMTYEEVEQLCKQGQPAKKKKKKVQQNAAPTDSPALPDRTEPNTQQIIPDATEVTKPRKQRARELNKAGYKFVYLVDSDVFHVPSCPVFLESTGDYRGFLDFMKAARDRRPCPVCNPILAIPESPEVEKESKKSKKKAGKLLVEPEPSTEMQVPAIEQTVPVPDVIPEKPDQPDQKTIEPAPAVSQPDQVVTKTEIPEDPNNILIRTKMLTGQLVFIKKRNIVGWCENSIHPGTLNRSLIEKHDCLGKNCPFLKKNPESAYWPWLERQNRIKMERKERIRREKEQKIAEEQEMAALRSEWSGYLETIGSNLFIVRVENTDAHAYRVFFVSDHEYSDAFEIPRFHGMLQTMYPDCEFAFRHVRDVDGHFVTREEYISRSRRKY